MSAEARRISSEEWRRHESTIKDLYFVRGLLVESKTGRVDLVHTMREEHGFSATAAQYVAKINKWSSPKNLKKPQSAPVIAVIDRLKATGLEARPVVSGRPLEASRLRRIRRHLGKEALASIANTTTQQLPPEVAIEVLGEDNVWKRYHDVSLVPEHHSLALSPPRVSSYHTLYAPPTAGQVIGGMTAVSQVDLGVLHEGLDHLTALSPANLQISEVGMDDILSFDDSLSGFSPITKALFEPYLRQTPALYDLELPNSSDIRSFDIVGPITRQPDLSISATPQTLDMMGTIMEKAFSISANGFFFRRIKSIPSEARGLLDSLMSLIDEDYVGEHDMTDLNLAKSSAASDSSFYKTMIYSFNNGLAGFEGIPRTAILAALREHDMSSQLFEFLCSQRPNLVKSLTYELLEAAIMECDHKTAKSIILAVKGTPNDIDLNAPAFSWFGQLWTPLDFAAYCGDFETVRVLLKLRNEDDKSCGTHPSAVQRALVLVIDWFPKTWGSNHNTDAKVVQELLAHGATITPTIAKKIIVDSQHVLLQQEVFEQLKADTHGQYFSLLPAFISYLDKKWAGEAVYRLLNWCEGTGCRKCVGKNPDTLRNALHAAASRDELDLCRFLLGYTNATDEALVKAFGNRNLDLVILLIQHGANPAAPAIKKGHCLNSPFAESIRTQDEKMIQIPEAAGVWSTIDNLANFKAAVVAAAEVEDLDRLKKLLARPLDEEKLTPILSQALVMAVREKKVQATMLLLNTAANVNNKRAEWADLFRILKGQDLQLIETFLDSDLELNTICISGLGDIKTLQGRSIIEELIAMSTPFDPDWIEVALVEAVSSGNKALIDLLFKNGARIGCQKSLEEDSTTLLQTAIHKSDRQDILRDLLSRGADPADFKAFDYAVSHNREGFAILLQAFVARYPDGCPRFGSGLIIHAMKEDDRILFQSLITAKMDVNSVEASERCKSLGFAIQMEECSLFWVGLLLDAGADPNGVVSEASSADMTNIEYMRSGRPQATALVAAVGTRDIDLVQLLLRRGARINEPAKRGIKRTPLQRACEIRSYDMVNLLLQSGADVNLPAAQRGGGTALQLAAAAGSMKIVKLLISWGGDIHAPPSKVYGRTALEVAAEHGRIDILKFLWSISRGFSAAEVLRALGFAKKEGQQDCEDCILGWLSAST